MTGFSIDVTEEGAFVGEMALHYLCRIGFQHRRYGMLWHAW